MKILFLDHDGVICLADNWGSRYKKVRDWKKNSKQPPPFHIRNDNLDPKCIKVLNEIIEVTDCEIVVSSYWRRRATLKEMQELYSFYNIAKVPIDMTEVIKSGFIRIEDERSKEINRWVKQNNPTTWVAVDDLDLTVKYFVRTPLMREGIKQSGIKEKIINILNNENS